MRVDDLGLPPMDMPAVLALVDPSDHAAYLYSDYPQGALAAYDQPVAKTLKLVRAVAKRLWGER